MQHIAFRCDVTGSRNLRGLTKILTGYQISKSARQSNWEADLSEKQIHYAASDAIASLNIMEKLVSKELSKGLSGTIRIICDRWGGNVSRSVLESDGGIACMHTLCQGLVGAPMVSTSFYWYNTSYLHIRRRQNVFQECLLLQNQPRIPHTVKVRHQVHSHCFHV